MGVLMMTADGSGIEWDEDGGQIVVRRAGSASWDDIHQAVFPAGPPARPRTLDEMKAGIRAHLKKKHGPSR